MNTSHSFDQTFQFQGKAKTWSLIFIVIGIVGILAGFALGYAERTFANMLLMGYYFACVCICGTFFCAVKYVSQAGWSASILRVPQAFGKALPVAAIVLIAIILAGLFITHPGLNEYGKSTSLPYLYKGWALKGITTKGSVNYDHEILLKSGYLNLPFFIIRIIGYLIIYIILGRLLVKYSENEDQLGGMFYYKRSFNVSVVFLVLFGFTIPLFAFDIIMSLEAQWFSTMFGWYNFAGLWVSGIAVITYVIIKLREHGHMPWITEDHLHNLGVMLFAFSIFWTYTWFAQFLLTWYANIPEESAYFYRRWQDPFIGWFWLNLIINIGVPLTVLMSRDSKRMIKVLKAGAVLLILGHWLDYWQMIMPGTTGPTTHWYTEIGPLEIAIFLGFAGLFMYTVLSALSKFKSLVPVNHPFLEESLHHHI